MGFIEDIRDFINSFSASEPKTTDRKKARWAFDEDKKSSEMTKAEPRRETRRESRESSRKRR